MESLFDSLHARLDQARIGWHAVGKEFPVQNQSLHALGQEQGVAKLHLGPGLMPHHDLNVRLVQAEYFVFVLHQALTNNPLMGLVQGGGQLAQHVVQALQHLLGLGAGPVGLLPLLVEQGAVALGVGAHHLGESFHFSQHLFALLFAVRPAGAVGHFNAQLIHLGDEAGRLGHPMLEALLTNQLHGLHERTRRVAQEHPVHWEMDVGLDAGAVQKSGLQVQGLGELQVRGLVPPLAEQLFNERTHLFFGQPGLVALQGAFAGHRYFVQLAQAAEPLQEGAVGQPDGQFAVTQLQEGADDIAAEGAAGVVLKFELLPGRNVGSLGLLFGPPVVHAGGDELGFHAAGQQQGIDASELAFKLEVIDIPLDGGQAERERLGERNQMAHGRKMDYNPFYGK